MADTNPGQFESSQVHLARSLQLAEESKMIGVNTLIKMDEQTGQMRRIKIDAEDTEHVIKGNRGVVKDMRRNWIVRLCCYNRSDIVPDEQAWESRDTPEEQMRVKKMIKLDKRRRRIRRLQNKDVPKPDQDPKAAGAAKSGGSWKFWKSSKDFSDDSDLSDISEDDDEDPPTAPADQGKPRILPKPAAVPKLSAAESDSIIFPDEDTALDHLHSTVQDLKVIAMQISETSIQQTSMLGTISDQVNKNQTHLDKNNQLIGKLGRRVKDNGDDGVLTAQDKLAILGVKSALTSKFNS